MGMGKLEKFTYTIKVDPKITPVSVPPRRLPPVLYEGVVKQIRQSDTNEIIKKIEWCSPLVTVRKANGDLRLCIDYRNLNNALNRERHQIPSFEELLYKMKDVKLFSKLDARSGYLQIPVLDK